MPAAFGRLCVETFHARPYQYPHDPAAFGRLCVETGNVSYAPYGVAPAAFGRLCVETAFEALGYLFLNSSRLRAAVC